MPPPSSSERTARGYDYPSNTQFSVFLENRVGKLAELIEILDGKSLQVVALSIAEASDYGVVRLVTTDGNRARELLRATHCPYAESEILAVELSPHQSLTTLCRCLLSAELSIHYAYPLMVRPHGAATIAIHTDDQVLASQILQRKKFCLLGESDLSSDF